MRTAKLLRRVHQRGIYYNAVRLSYTQFASTTKHQYNAKCTTNTFVSEQTELNDGSEISYSLKTTLKIVDNSFANSRTNIVKLINSIGLLLITICMLTPVF